MTFKDYYKILGIDNIKVTNEEIKTAYRNQAKKFHPDINKESTGEIIKDINEAYKILSNPQSKKKYDKLWNGYIGRTKKENISFITEERKNTMLEELSNIFFGNTFKKHSLYKEKKEDTSLNTEITLKLSIKEAYLGTTKIIKTKDDQKDLEIPKNTKNNDIHILKYMGKKSNDPFKFPGDLYVRISVENDEIFKLKGLNIISNLNLTPAEAILGTNIEFDFFGELISIIVPPFTPNQKEFKLKNKGFSSSNQKGDLILIANIVIPSSISKEEEKLYNKIRTIEKNAKQEKK